MSQEQGTAGPHEADDDADRRSDEESTWWFDAPVPDYDDDASDAPAGAVRPEGSHGGGDDDGGNADAAGASARRPAYAPTAPIPLSPPKGTGYTYETGGSTVGAGDGSPGASSPARPPTPRRGPVWVGLATLALVFGLIGGIGGQLLADRTHLGGSAGSGIPEPGPGVTARPSGSIAGIAAAAIPSVVTIKVRGDRGSGTGSGFVIDDRGHILTNNHVIGGVSTGGDIEVLLSNGQTEKAAIVGRDVSYDLAVLKMERQGLAPLKFGASDGVVVGDEVIAVGAPLGLEQTVTSGIVSALNRPVTPGSGDEASFINAIQTDAAINPGNSGGPLLDMSGQVIGVNSAIARVPGPNGGGGGNIGLGFAIPSDQARRTADQLIAKGKATHPMIGVLLDRSFSGAGAQVVDGSEAVTAGGPADKAGIKPGDVIVGFDGKPIRTPDQLIVSIRSRAVGDTVTLTVKRDGKDVDLKMTLEAAPDQ